MALGLQVGFPDCQQTVYVCERERKMLHVYNNQISSQESKKWGKSFFCPDSLLAHKGCVIVTGTHKRVWCIQVPAREEFLAVSVAVIHIMTLLTWTAETTTFKDFFLRLIHLQNQPWSVAHIHMRSITNLSDECSVLKCNIHMGNKRNRGTRSPINSGNALKSTQISGVKSSQLNHIWGCFMTAVYFHHTSDCSIK